MTSKVISAWVDVTVGESFSSLAKTSLKSSKTKSKIEKVVNTLLSVIKAIKVPLNRMSEIKISLIKMPGEDGEKRVDVMYNPKELTELEDSENMKIFLKTIKTALDKAIVVLSF
jgi:hypothetical protein